MAEEHVVIDGAETTPNAEAEARGMGWLPQEEFRGDPTKWVSAEEYVKRGQDYIPFLRANERKLKEALSARDAKLNEMERLLKANNEAIAALATHQQEAGIEEITNERNNLRTAISEARKSGDTDREFQLRDELDAVDERLATARRAGPANGGAPTNGDVRSANTPPPGVDYREDPVWKEFMANHPEANDEVWMFAANNTSKRLWTEGRMQDLTPAERFELTAVETNKRFGQAPRKPTKVESGRPSGGGGGDTTGGTGRSFNDLPQDAKDACGRLANQFIGKKDAMGKVAYPDQAAWQKHYVELYFSK